MQIKEVQEKLKISSYTLRYYEKMGLIQPYRDENGYRNYSEEDIHKIERIMFLRDINVPIEDIKDILNNKVTFQDVLERHIQKVNTEIESLQYIKNMCEDLKEKNIPLLDNHWNNSNHSRYSFINSYCNFFVGNYRFSCSCWNT